MTTYHSDISTLDATAGTNVLDYSALMFRKPLPGGDIKLWPLISKVSDMYDTILYWIEDALVPITVKAVDSASGVLTASNSDTNLVFASGETAAGTLTPGTVLRNLAAGSRERILLTVDNGSESFTIVREWGGTPTVEAHLQAAEWEVVMHLNYEGSGFGTPVSRKPTRMDNTTMILDTQVRMTGTERVRRYYSINDYWTWQVAGAMERFERQLERALIWSQGVARADTVNVYGSMKGIQDFIIAGAGDSYTSSFGAFNYESIDAVLATQWANGYEDGNYVLVLPPTGVRYCAYIDQPQLFGTYMGEMTRGMQATALKSTLGITVPIIPSTAIQSDEFLLLDLNRIKMHFMVGRELIGMYIPYGNNGDDLQKRRVLSEMSLELHNADKAHHYAQGVTYTIPS